VGRILPRKKASPFTRHLPFLVFWSLLVKALALDKVRGQDIFYPKKLAMSDLTADFPVQVRWLDPKRSQRSIDSAHPTYAFAA